MDLPRALLPWRQSLSIFPEDLAIALGGVIDKLALLIGPLVSPDGGGRGEPDGVDGVGRRGSFDRLLATEWALAEEAPLEFLRRVSTGELSFLDIAHKKPAVARQCVALFDVGPDGRGGPRIVHLAALILLAQRARDGGASFSWGVLQDESTELVSDVNEESVRKLLKAASNRRMVVDDAIRFYQAFHEEEPEVWFVGSASTTHIISEISPHLIEVEDSFDPDKPFDVIVNVFGNQKKTRAVRLELPPKAASVRLIRDPFQVARVTPQKSKTSIDPRTNIVFCRTNRKLFLRGSDGELLTIPIPNSPNATEVPKPRVFRPPSGQWIVGVGRHQKSSTLVVAAQTDDALVLHHLSKRGCTSMRHEQYRTLAGTSVPNAQYILPVDVVARERPKLGTLLFVDDTSGYLYNEYDEVFSFMHEKHTAIVLSNTARAAFEHDYHFCILCRVSQTLMRSFPPKPRDDIFLNVPFDNAIVAPSGHFGLQRGNEAWIFMDAAGKRLSSKRIEDGHTLLAIVDATQPCFVSLDESRTQIVLVGAERPETWVNSPVPIRAAAANVRAWLAAFITEENELCVYSREHNTLVLRLRLGEP